MTRKILLVCILALIPAFILVADDSPAVKAELDKLHGEWTMVSGKADGSPLPDFIVSRAKRVCDGDTITVTAGEQLIMKARVKIDPTQKPKTINFEIIDGPTKGKTQLGIYEVDGNTLKSCFAAPSEPRPAKFETV